MDTLMRMQSSYDIAQTRKREKQIRVPRISLLAATHSRETTCRGTSAARLRAPRNSRLTTFSYARIASDSAWEYLLSILRKASSTFRICTFL